MTAAPIIRIVDDDPNIHDALAYVLENEGFIVRHYESAESFLINDRPEDPGCAILDVRMGEMSGIVLHDRMKKLGSKLPCIFLSAHGDVDMAVDAIEAGAVTFLSKPVRTEKLLAAIERALTIAQSLTCEPEQTLDGTPSREAALTDEAARQAALTEAARTAFLSLSDRERQAALLAVSGLTNRQIAERLEIAVRTVEFHRAGSMRKLGCHSAAELKAKLSLVPEAREAFE
ncbi:response regulator transcription factor [Sutterella wadsworthensis]|uniref:response regulator transcription factor n=1 Tax=Sutterella wadsworthensis TaxID=40545 RepID=UPI0013F6060B|nr:response regulator [Sutterella wadsworthensis]